MRSEEGTLVDKIETELLQKIANMFGGQPRLADSLMMVGVDSVGMAELTFDIEKHFGIRVDDTVLDVDTVQDLANYIRQRHHG